MKHKNLFIYLISSVLCTLPLPLFVNTIFFILLIIYTIFYAITNKIKPHFNIETGIFIILYLLMALSYFWSINKHLTLLGIERKVAFLLMPLLFIFIPKFNPEESKRIFRYFSFAMVIYAVFFLVVGISNYLITGDLKNLGRHWLVNPLKLSRIYVSLFSIVAIFHVIFHEKKGVLKTILLSTLSLFLILLSSKTIIITTLLVLFFFVNKRSSFKMRFKYLVSSFLVVMAVLVISEKVNPQFFSELIPRFNEVTTKKDFQKNYYFNGAELRILYTRFLFEYENEENIFLKGFGLNATQQKLNEKCKKYRVPEGYGTSFNFHNQYNQTFAEIGIIGLLLLLCILYFGFKKANKINNPFSMSVIIVFTALLSTETVFNRQRGIYFFLIMYLIIINTKNQETSTNIKPCIRNSCKEFLKDN